MKRYQSLMIVTGVIVALLATALTALAGGFNLKRAADVTFAPPEGNAAATCTKMTASEVAWVTLDEDGEIVEQVESYPTETTEIVPFFEYNCVPKNTTLVTVFTYEGEQVYNDKEKLKATNSKGTYGYPLQVKEGTFDLGEWGVEFYNSKTLLTSGAVQVGDEDCGDECGGETVTLQGVVTDKRTKKPIKGATVVLLNPGITVEEFVDTQKEEDVYAIAQTNSKGQFIVEQPLEREVGYGIIILAKGYKPLAQDDFTIAADDPDPYELTITMTK